MAGFQGGSGNRAPPHARVVLMAHWLQRPEQADESGERKVLGQRPERVQPLLRRSHGL